MTVDLPAPEWPVRNANSPLATWKETSLSARPPLEGLEDVRELDHLVSRQGLGEVRDEVIGILQSQGKSQKSVRYASLRALFRRETRVGGEPRLRDQRLH